MSQVSGSEAQAPTRWSIVGPGLVVAATGVGAGDLLAALVAGQRYGLTFIWAIALGVVLKFALNEGVGRYTLGTGRTILEGIHSLGRWASGYFGVYTLIWGFSYGAAATSSCALAMSALIPAIPFWGWAVLHGLAGCVLVLTNTYQRFERLVTALVGLMFITVVGSALLVLPRLGDIMATGLPTLPDGSLLYALGLIGGVGGSITMASYGYWLVAKGWKSDSHIRIMRLDCLSAYVITGIFCLAMLVMGAAILYGTDMTVSGQQGVVTFAGALGNQLHPVVRLLFLIGFWAASFTSVLGVWNGVSWLWADFIRLMRQRDVTREVLNTTGAYRFYVLWLTFPPMLLHLLGKPVLLVIVYGALGAIFMPFLAIVLMVLLNSDRIEAPLRSSWRSNLVLTLSLVLFAVLMGNELLGMG
ncbi:Mn2+/Fe2+ NRAMP family transporter [Kushneria sinocarnis]|uniref:Mn2+/Fe2+ NRAMP family transporter n=1 Tax=Kushneria sinocarnis TaxID=595502 RepID=A0A420WXJ5_9GAMM|nr:Nramp family divalent metal transporter [Kushneria sinocarnis]RKR04465.1 Mn2+/Fe2+ NRAMP family transporter [Kushneria sinocarnis]